MLGWFDPQLIAAAWFDPQLQPVAWFDEQQVTNTSDGSITGTLSATEGQDTATLDGALVYSGGLAATEGQDSASIVGSVVAEVSGSLAATEAQDTSAFAGVLVYSGALVATEASDVVAFAGDVAGAAITGDLAATEAQDTASFVGSIASSSLHGRSVRRRGKVVRFADEIDAPAAPVPTERKEALVEYGDLLAQVRQLTAQFEAGQRKRASKAKQAALQAKINTLDARIAELAQIEQIWINRLREEDELFLLAA